MIPSFFPWTPLALVFAAVTMTGIVLFGRRDDPDRIRKRHPAVPGLPDDGEMEPWHWDEWDRIEAFYADTAHDPMTARNAPRRGRWAPFSRR